MATDVNTTTQAPAAPKVKTVLEDMDSRRMFDTPTDAAAYLNTCLETIPDLKDQHIIAKGVTTNDQGGLDFDTNVYTSDMRVMIAVLTQRVTNGPSKVTAVVVTPAPKLDSILASDAGKVWLAGIVDKELNHVAVRQLRNPKDGANLDELAEAMPTTLEGYVTSTRADGGALETFNELARGIIEAIAKKNKAWAKMRLTKNELRAAMSSKAYAAEYYPTLEDRGEGKESLFVMALNFGKTVAAAKGLAPDIFDRWLSMRDETKLVAKSDSDSGDDDFDISALTFDDATEKKTDAAPTPAPAAPAADSEVKPTE